MSFKITAIPLGKKVLKRNKKKLIFMLQYYSCHQCYTSSFAKIIKLTHVAPYFGTPSLYLCRVINM